jgi:hypothetical protein
MKIVHVPFCFYPDPSGGTEVYVKSLASRQQQYGANVVIAAPGNETSSYEYFGLPVRRFAISNEVTDLRVLYGEGDVKTAQAFAEILDEERPDIVCPIAQRGQAPRNQSHLYLPHANRFMPERHTPSLGRRGVRRQAGRPRLRSLHAALSRIEQNRQRYFGEFAQIHLRPCGFGRLIRRGLDRFTDDRPYLSEACRIP